MAIPTLARKRELRIVARDADVGELHEPDAPAEAMAEDGGDDRLFHFDDVAGDGPPDLERGALEIRPDAECAVSRPGEDRDPVLAVVEPPPGGLEGPPHVLVHGVENLGPVQRDDGDVVSRLVENDVRRHRAPPGGWVGRS
jgi:hypothetical protein